MIFFNKVLFVGFFGAMLQLVMVWPFLGLNSLVFLVVTVLSIISIRLNYKGFFTFSKSFFVFSIYALRGVTTIMLGGSGLYHLGIFSTFTFSLILFNKRKEWIAIVLGAIIIVFVILIGELSWFGAPDYSHMPETTNFRFANISSLLLVNSILLNFILRLNRKTEQELSKSWEDLKVNTDELEVQKSSLESLVKDRTKEILSQNNELERKNKEKEVLLQEVHHRVKNNLQIIVSLINLYRNKEVDTKTELALREIQTRVSSMALVHREMYEKSDFLEIRLHTYCDQLMQNIGHLYHDKPFDYHFNIDSKITLEMNEAIPLGLILNEIVINFFKHAYQSEKENAFTLLVEEKNQVLHFTCYDNGAGFSDTVLERNSDTLGIEIIEGLTDQVNGMFEISNKPDAGACYHFTVKH